MILLQLSDFKGGKYDIPDSDGYYTSANVQESIDTYEKKYIYSILGVVLGDLFIAWLAANQAPANADYLKILKPFSEDDSCGLVQSLGFKEALKGCVFYEDRKNGLKTSQAGVVKSESETAIAASPASTLRFAENKYNDIVETISAIQWYCLKTPAAFPDFNGRRMAVKASNLF